MTDKELLASIHLNPVSKNLHLRAFPAINHKGVVFHLQNLRREVPAVERAAGRITQDGEFHD